MTAIPDGAEIAETELVKTASFVESVSNLTDLELFLTTDSFIAPLEETLESHSFSMKLESEFPAGIAAYMMIVKKEFNRSIQFFAII